MGYKDDRFEDKAKSLKVFLQTNHRYPSFHDGGNRESRTLGSWVARQRLCHRKSVLSPFRIGVLEGVDSRFFSVVASMSDDRFEGKAKRLKDFLQTNHCYPSFGERGNRESRILGSWVAKQRLYYRTRVLSPFRIDVLEGVDPRFFCVVARGSRVTERRCGVDIVSGLAAARFVEPKGLGKHRHDSLDPNPAAIAPVPANPAAIVPGRANPTAVAPGPATAPATANDDKEETEVSKLVCRIIKRGQEGEDDKSIGFVVLKSRAESFVYARQAILHQGVPINMGYMFYVPHLGPIAVKQELSLGPMVAFLETCTPPANLGDGSYANPVKVFLVGAPVL
jgi:hypothetical protein